MRSSLFECPCCHFPTLSELGGFDICVICWWEDDGQNESNADIVRGGPNGKYSLTHAQKNFLAHGHMYDFGEGIEVVETPSVARRELMKYVSLILHERSSVDRERLEQLLNAV